MFEEKEIPEIVERIGKYVELTRKGNQWWGCCPFHEEKTPSFCVEPEKNLYHCFGCNESGTLDELVNKLSTRMKFFHAKNLIIDSSTSMQDLISKIMSFVQRQYKNHSTVSGLSTGFYFLDGTTGGFQKGQLVTINRYGFWQKEFSYQLMLNLFYKKNVRTGLFNFESTNLQAGLELLSLKSEEPLHKIRSGMLKLEDFRFLNDAAGDLYNSNFFVEECFQMTFDEFFMELKKQISRKQLQIIFIDSLNSIPLGSDTGTQKERQLEVLKKLKALAIESGTTIVTSFYLSESEKEKALKPKTQFQKQYCDVQILLHKASIKPTEGFEEEYEIEISSRDNAMEASTSINFNKMTRLFSEIIYSDEENTEQISKYQSNLDDEEDQDSDEEEIVF